MEKYKNVIKTNVTTNIYIVYSKIFKKSNFSKLLYLTIFSIISMVSCMYCQLSEACANGIVYGTIAFLIIKWTNYNYILEYYWLKITKKGNFLYNIYIYNKYLKYSNDIIQKEINYSEFEKIVETDNLVFLVNDDIITIEKNPNNDETISYLKKKITEHEDLSGDKKYKMKQQKLKTRQEKIVFYGLVFSVLSFLIAFYSWGYLNRNYPNALSPITTWIYYCFIPVPITSIILCLCFKNAKRVFIPIIVLLLLLSYGRLYKDFNYNYKKDYSLVESFEKVAGFKFSTDGLYYRIEWDNIRYRNLISNYIIFGDNNIVLGEDWIKVQEFLNKFKNYIPEDVLLEIDDDSLLSIYFEKYDVYNILPEEANQTKIYIMVYQPKKLWLQIDSYYIE